MRPIEIALGRIPRSKETPDAGYKSFSSKPRHPLTNFPVFLIILARNRDNHRIGDAAIAQGDDIITAVDLVPLKVFRIRPIIWIEVRASFVFELLRLRPSATLVAGEAVEALIKKLFLAAKMGCNCFGGIAQKDPLKLHFDRC